MNRITMGRLASLARLKEADSLNQAAGSAGRQAQFSRQIRELEEACGQSLVDREGYCLRLSRKGREVVRCYEQLWDSLRGLDNQRDEGEIVVAGGELALVKWAIPLLRSMLPQLDTVVRFRNMRSLEALQGFRRGEVDVVLSSVKPTLRGTEESVQQLSKGGYLAISGEIRDISEELSVREAVGLPLVLLEGETPVRTMLEREAEKQGRKLEVEVLCSTYEQMLTIAAGCNLYAVVPGICRPVAEAQMLGVRNLVGSDVPSYSIWILTSSKRKGDLSKVVDLLHGTS